MKHPDNNEYSPFGQYESALPDFLQKMQFSRNRFRLPRV